jgi:hypothetical protein
VSAAAEYSRHGRAVCPLSPLVAWVEQGADPGPVVASGTNFTSPPATRSWPLCPYPEEARYIGLPGDDLGNAANYKRIEPRKVSTVTSDRGNPARRSD